MCINTEALINCSFAGEPIAGSKHLWFSLEKTSFTSHFFFISSASETQGEILGASETIF
jgi:hypothetical protein